MRLYIPQEGALKQGVLDEALKQGVIYGGHFGPHLLQLLDNINGVDVLSPPLFRIIGVSIVTTLLPAISHFKLLNLYLCVSVYNPRWDS